MMRPPRPCSRKWRRKARVLPQISPPATNAIPASAANITKDRINATISTTMLATAVSTLASRLFPAGACKLAEFHGALKCLSFGCIDRPTMTGRVGYRGAAKVRDAKMQSRSWLLSAQQGGITLGSESNHKLFATVEHGPLDQARVIAHQLQRLAFIKMGLLAWREFAPGRAARIEQFFPADLPGPFLQALHVNTARLVIMKIIGNPVRIQPHKRLFHGVALLDTVELWHGRKQAASERAGTL